ncbi:Der1-like protein [Testicularia cyperi]|uniref:Derlin n=1 Tax=Testicularia cyperi TaxID=1882483 RepID=A0A317XWA9_9BASI|nr:Der1-like protein [Testicularia cyperi]
MDLETIPPITGVWGGATLAVALLEHTHVISSFQLFYTPSLVLRKYQLWRLLTTFLYFGPLGIDFLLHLFFFMRYSRMLEQESFGGRRGGKAGYVYLLAFSAVCLLILSPIAAQPFLGSPLAFVLVYIWSRRNRHVRLSLFGVLIITAPYLPWSLLIFGWLLHGSLQAVVGDLLGIAVGHLYYFLVDVWPRELKSGGRNLLATPRFLVQLIDGEVEQD